MMDLETEIHNIFEKKVNFVFICGSFLKNTNRLNCDIDIFCCVESLNKKQRQEFINLYFDFHKEKNANPDLYYPGELMSRKELQTKLELTKEHKPQLQIKDKRIYDGIVWAGMIANQKKIILGKIPEKIISLSHECIKKWNKSLFNLNTLSIKKLQEKIIFEGEIELKAEIILNRILKNKEAIIKILLEIESYETLEDEFFKSIDCLKNIKIEKEFLRQVKVRYISAFFPVNLPLYSLIIFGFIPFLMSEKIFIKVPDIIAPTLKKIKAILFENNDSIYISQLDKKSFVKDFVKQSEVILFTGRYPSVKTLEKNFPDKLIIYNGAGINPIIINKNADLKYACKKVIKARTFNSGQDCAGPDQIFIHKTLYNNFINLLVQKLKRISIGNYKNKKVSVGKLLKPVYISELKDLLKKKRVLFGGKIDGNKKIIYPTIIEESIDNYKNYREYFAPIFWISSFKDERELKGYFETKKYLDFAMYASVFGDSLKFKIPRSIVLFDKIIMDVERGNLPYGGYGRKAQFISYKGIRKIRPILISKEIFQWKKHLCKRY